MTEIPKTVTLTPAMSRALLTFAERTGRTAEELATEAIERFIADEEPIVEKVLQALEEVRNGQVVTHEEAVRGFRETIARAALRRA